MFLGSWIPYLWVFLAYLIFVAFTIRAQHLRMYGTHLWKAYLSSNWWEIAYLATCIGKASFMSFRGSHDVDPSFQSAYKYHPLLVLLRCMLPLLEIVNFSSSYRHSLVLLWSIISSSNTCCLLSLSTCEYTFCYNVSSIFLTMSI